MSWPACGPVDNGNDNSTNDNSSNDNGTPNDNGVDNGGPGVGEIFIEENSDTADFEAARALSGNDTQYALFGQKSGEGATLSIEQVDVILAGSTGLAVRLTMDGAARPLSLLSEDGSALQISYSDSNDTVTSTFVDVFGETTRAALELETDPIGPVNPPNFTDLCPYLQPFVTVTDAILEDCGATATSPLCSGSVAESVDAIADLCALTLEPVSGELAPGLGSGPALTIPLGVFIEASALEATPGSSISLRATSFGGLPPYAFVWSVESGPESPAIAPTNSGSISTASLTLSVNGTYNIRVRVTDADIRLSFFDVAIEIRNEPGELSVATTIEVDDSEPFLANLTADPAGGAEPYTYAWSAFEGPEGSTVDIANVSAANTTATFDVGGTFILELQVSDAEGQVVISRPAVTIVDPATSLIANLVIPDCEACTDPDCTGNDCPEAPATSLDTCVAVGDSLALEVAVTNGTDCTDGNTNDNDNGNTNDNGNSNDNDNTNDNGNANDNDNDNTNTNDNGEPEECFELVYSWQIVEGAGSGFLVGSTTATPQLVTIGPGAVVVEVQVTDPNDDEVSLDRMSIDVVECGDGLSVDILSDGVPQDETVCEAFATLNSPIFLRSVVEGFSGILEFEWEAVEGGGSFDDAAAQNVMFTPDTLSPNSEVHVTVTDTATGATATATEVVCVATFSTTIAGPQANCGTAEDPCDVESNDLFEFEAIPSADGPAAILYDWSIVDATERLDSNDQPTGVFDLDDNNMTVTLFDEDTATVRMLAVGDGDFQLQLRGEDATDDDNVATAIAEVVSDCLDADDPEVSATVSVEGEDALTAVVADEGDDLALICLADLLLGRDVSWSRLDGGEGSPNIVLSDPAESDDDADDISNDIDHCPDTAITDRPVDEAGCGQLQLVDPANFKYISHFTMPAVSSSSIVDVLEYSCTSSNAGPRCDDESNTVYVVPDMPPVVGASDDTEDQTVSVGSTVTVVCEQASGARATDIVWQQVPKTTVDDMAFDTATGVLTFTAPDTAETLVFECQGSVILGGAVQLEGEFSTADQATIVVED
jgi:hypothetical protein